MGVGVAMAALIWWGSATWDIVWQREQGRCCGSKSRKMVWQREHRDGVAVKAE
uniref:Uncharacterized protein n=1 Tax=Amphimedon queenslandica TaxID=400682 RepID=A0A1X7T997_AMPQE